MADGSHRLMRFSGEKDFGLLWRTTVQVAETGDLDVASLYADHDYVYLLAGLPPTRKDGVQLLRASRLSDGKEEKVIRIAVETNRASGLKPPNVSTETSRTPDAPPSLPPSESIGKAGTKWFARGKEGLIQQAPDGTTLRHLALETDEPLPVAVSASIDVDRLYLLEETPGWQRVRGLSWLESKEENGQAVSTWQTFFDRSIRLPASDATPSFPVEINLDENPLTPGKPQKIRVVATFDSKGSYLAAENGLRLRRISERPNLQSVRLAKGKPPSPLDFFQYDGAATDEFSISGVHRIMEFDAGEFEMTATGEKPAETRNAEPPDL